MIHPMLLLLIPSVLDAQGFTSLLLLYGSTTNGNSGNAQEQFYLSYIDALFLCSSAMTNSGLSVANLSAITGFQQAVPYDTYSFSGTWHTLSKLILICVMICGRHRGLPYAVDRAVLLPGEELMEKMDTEVDGRGRDKNGVH
ncbi:hypothetical protein E4T38_05078 [Aureobasidium subglaciale]|nr:hypothetical protein E4T38_05078 [Aureobasidium subglaciale]KAI5222098.1 hypothetical protein E4T40_05116 [Aureobasidium subglaciale]KAI5225873.1 hypothetical protein E4T41_04935 [Aureobasidium subglaciale]KAI5261883.1 hypothetical protein E4T46_04828 [Aureobasidium subglaciale]